MGSKSAGDALYAELRTLRKNRGIYSDPINTRVGPSLRAACGITDQDGPAEVRGKVSDRLANVAALLPADFRVAVLAAFALAADARQQFYQDRMRWAADQIRRDDRTARRRADDGTRQLAELLAGQLDRGATGDASRPAELWHSASLTTVLNLTLTTPEAFEFRRVVADQDDLRELDLAVTLTAPPPGVTTPATGLAMDVLYGGSLVRRTMESARRYGMALALPSPLNRGDEHEFAVRFRVPDGETLSPHFVVVPQQPCDRLEVRVKFDEKKLPAAVWRLTKIFQNELDDPAHRVDKVTIDNVAELHVQFAHPLPGFAYGVQWDLDQDDPDKPVT